jgi:hypothetical protein
MKPAIASLIVLAVFGLGPHPVGAEAWGDGNLKPNGDTTTHTTHETYAPVPKPGSGAPPQQRDSGKATPLVSYVSYQLFGDGPARTGDLTGLCWLDGTHTKPGYQYRIVGTAADGSVVEDRLVCQPFDPATQKPVPPQLPRLPTIAEAWGAAQLPDPIVVTDPATRGITGLETRISTTGPTSLDVHAPVDGYDMVAHVHLDHYTISVDGGPAVRADHDSYMFETKGNHTIEITAVWKGDATLTGPDLIAPIHIDDIGTATLTTTRTYPVHEIRSVLQP